MYDRTVRFQDVNTNASTSVDVGPGSYDINVFKRKEKEGYAPFSSLFPRESFLTIKDDGNAFPGPGEYEAKVIYDHIKGASSISNKSVRFNEKINETPGPGNYEISRFLIKKDQNKNNSVKRAPLHHRSFVPPSIPSPGQAFGYEEGNDGILRKQRVPDIDKSLGPAFYPVSHEETAVVQKYKGVHFGSLTAKRVADPKIPDTPGPGAYTISEIPANLNSIIKEEQNKKPVEAKLPRYHEIVPMLETKKAIPGPGRYEIKGQFEPKEPVYDAGLRPSFGAQSRRFSSPKGETPAPDAYNDRRHGLETCDKVSGLKQSPFGQTSRRFQNDHHVTRTPGPDSYNIAGLGDELQRKAFLSTNLRGAFGSSSKRTFPFKKKDDQLLPGPSHYSVQSAPASVLRGKKNAVFKSSTNRLLNPANSVPPPGSYNISRTFSKPQSVLCKVPGKPIDGGFLSSTKRFSQPRDIIVKKTDIATPGPGNYDIKSPSTPGVSIKTKVDRFKDVENDVPGPGTYQLSPLLQHSVLRGTFNATLNNPVQSVLTHVSDNASQISLKVTA